MQDDLKDVDLLAVALGGRSEAFGKIFQRHGNVIYNYCFRRLGSLSDAEDATSLVFLETWRRRRDAVNVEGSLLPWLIGVANNVTRNMNRTGRRYDAALYKISHLTVEPDPADVVAERVDAERRATAIIKVVARLSRTEQDVISAVMTAGLTYAEASVALNIPIGTVRSRLSRARKRLDHALGSIPANVSSTSDQFTVDAGKGNS